MSLRKKIILSLLTLLAIADVAVCAVAYNYFVSTRNVINNIQEEAERKNKVKAEVLATQPISILLMGIDTGGLGRDEAGRSDTMMVVTVNPTSRQTTVMSIQRDICTYLDGSKSCQNVGINDKINHSYAYGKAGMSMDTVQKLLNIPIDHYIAINLDGMRDLVDAIGGIEINNRLGEFTVTDCNEDYGKAYITTVKDGRQHANGEVALAYARMRHEDPDGDMGRNARQREVLQLIVKKLLSFDSITKYKGILKAVEKNVKMDLSFADLKSVYSGYLPSFKKVVQMELQGYGTTENEVYYQYLPQDLLLEAQNYLRKQMNLSAVKSIEDPDLPTFERAFYRPYDGEKFELMVSDKKKSESSTTKAEQKTKATTTTTKDDLTVAVDEALDDDPNASDDDN